MQNTSSATRNPSGMSLDMSGKVALITGGGKGVGLGVSERFLASGAEVVVCGRNPLKKLPEYEGKKAFFVQANVCDAEQIQTCIDFTLNQCGSLDVLVNNAGGSPVALAADASPRFSEAIIRLNLIAPLLCAQAANKVMQAQPQGGRIINIASVSAIRPSPGTAAYGAAKAGLVNLTASLAIEWAPKVRVNTIISGLIKTEQSHLHYGDEQGLANVAQTIPLERMGTPADIGMTCVYLASPLADYVTGAALTIHGGGEKPAFINASNAKTNPSL